MNPVEYWHASRSDNGLYTVLTDFGVIIKQGLNENEARALQEAHNMAVAQDKDNDRLRAQA